MQSAERKLSVKGISMTPPCKNCTDRHAACHADCERYKAYRASLEERHAEEQKRREVNTFAMMRMRKNEKYRQKIAGHNVVFKG